MTDEKTITTILVVLVLALLGWVIYKMVQGRRAPDVRAERFQLPVESELILRAVGTPLVREQFEMNGMPRAEEMRKPAQPVAAEVPAAHAKPVDFGRPYVDATVGVLIDGPGYEQQTDDWTFGEPTVGIPSNAYYLDDGAGGAVSIQHNLCSKSCCAEQWPTPFKLRKDEYVCDLKRKGDLVGSNYFCNNTFQDSGCLCLTRPQSQFLYNRGTQDAYKCIILCC